MRQSSASRDGAGFGGRRVLAGGGTALAVIFAFVAANAIWYQPHAHRSPILSTRAVQLPQPTTPSTEPGTVRDREIAAPDEEDEEPTTVIRLEAEEPASAAGDPLVADVQRVIAELGLYEGEIDGLPGPMTRAAIEAYQNMIGVPVTGQIDGELVAKLGITGETPVPVPPTARPDREQAERAATDTVQTASLGDEIGDALVMRVQAALRAFGNDDIEIDGVVGPRTSAAIREFQSLFGLPETGDPDREVYAKMREIGLAD